ncbi:tyrosine-protein phosphatase [Ilumatobacter nonamiensis]|uniref:tyrosine-protein phosphatase n=1 Tax=Ilumatobacter nonamiensis TaxID=467093 RepID=UPI000688983F|nr:tyrosine-protein phosphatase [Ilumatobacter nonamiensis]
MVASTMNPTRASLDVVDDPQRLVPLDAVHNFRDLGGYATDDGRMVGWGRLFRADGLFRLTDSDLDVLDALGIRTVVDLRSAPEFEQHGRFPLEKYPVAFHHLPIIDATWQIADIPDVDDTEAGAVEFLTWAYSDMLIQGADRFANAFQVLAVPGAAPAVFHCAAGKDRTGVLAALILGGLGVDHEAIVADYALTEAAMVRMRDWVMANHPEMADRMGETPSFMLASKPQAMRNILDTMTEEYGSVRGYLSTIGIGQALLAEMADAVTV